MKKHYIQNFSFGSFTVRWLALLNVVAGLAFSAPADASIYYNYDAGNGASFAGLAGAEDEAGSSAVWTQSNTLGGYTSLVDSFGNPATAQFFTQAGWMGSIDEVEFNDLQDDRFYQHYNFDGGFGAGITPNFGFTNLNPTATYDVYIYGSSGWTTDWWQYNVIGPTNTTMQLTQGPLIPGPGTTPGTTTAVWFEGEDYVKFSRLTGSSYYYFQGKGRNPNTGFAGPIAGYATFAGAQLVEVEAIPEPSTVMLLAAGGWILLRHRRRLS